MNAPRTLELEVEPGVILHISLELDKGKPAVIFSNSLAADLRMWDQQVSELRGLASVIRYDQRGHGRSSTLRSSLTVRELGTDVLRLLDHLGVEKVIFCGLSLGGLTGQWLGIHYPERLHGLLLANTASNFPQDIWIERANQARAYGMKHLVEPTLKRWFTEEFAARCPEEIQRVREIILGTDPHGYAACGDALRMADIADDIHRIQCPVWVIAGRYDPATPLVLSEEIVRAIPDAELITLEAAHITPIEAAKPFGVLLRDFVSTYGHGTEAARKL